MGKKVLYFAAFVFLLVGAGLVYALQTKTADRPQGVEAAMWVQLSENSGIALKEVMPARGWAKSGVHGTLMVKSGNIWHAVYLDAGPPGGEILPVKK